MIFKFIISSLHLPTPFFVSPLSQGDNVCVDSVDAVLCVVSDVECDDDEDVNDTTFSNVVLVHPRSCTDTLSS
jgi:hypothetical protein